MAHDGLYLVAYGSPNDPNARGGIFALLLGGKIYGGDAVFYFTGTFQSVAGKIDADVDVVKNDPNVATIFGTDAMEYKVILSGDVAADGSITGGMQLHDGTAAVGPTIPTWLALKKRL